MGSDASNARHGSNKELSCHGGLLQNLQSVGSVRLGSSNSKDAPICDPGFLSHPFDRTNFINSVKAALAIPGNPAASADIDFPLNAPSIESDEEIWSYIQQNTAATWHMVSSQHQMSRALF